MRCEFVNRQISGYLDNEVADEYRVELTTHLEGCRDCSGKAEEMQDFRRTLRSLPVRPAPLKLTTALLVVASKEKKRRAIRANWKARRAEAADQLRLWRDNLMRPFAVPAAGGLAGAVLSTFCILGLFTPTLVMQCKAAHLIDPPTGLITQPRLAGTVMPLTPSTPGDLTVELTVDEQGRMVDYRLPDGPKIQDEARRKLENDLLFTRFTPATAFGQPILGKVRITFHHAQIDIKG